MRKEKEMNKKENVVVNGVTFNYDKTRLIKYPSKRKSNFYVIPDGVETIANCAFENSLNLTTLSIPKSITDIEVAAFHGCHNLKSILLPRFSDFSFESGRLYKTTRVNETNERKDITDMVFYPDIDYRIPEDRVSMPDFEIFTPNGGITWEGDSFDKVEFHGTVRSIFLHKNVTEVSGSKFNAFDKLQKFTVDDENPLFKSINGVLFSKDGTVLYKYPNGLNAAVYQVPDGVKIIGHSAFSNNEEIKEIILPDSLNTLKSHAFMGCTDLRRIVLPSNLKTIGNCAFEDCCSLKELIIPESVRRIGKGAFRMCGIEKIVLNSTIDSINPGTFQFSQLGSIEIGSGVKYIGENAFAGSCLTSITIPDSVEVIGQESFENCEYLKTVHIGTGVTAVRAGAFSDCDNLESFSVDKKNPKYTSIDGILIDKLNNCIEEYPPLAPMPSSFMKVIDGVVFWENRLMRYPKDKPDIKYSIPSWVKDIEPYAFEDCEHLEELVLPTTWRAIPYKAFTYCHSLKRVTISSNIWKIGRQAFKGCYNLEEINLPAPLAIIGEEAFKDCPNLKKIQLPSGLDIIEKGAFNLCTGLTELTIPRSVSSIEDKAFLQCRGLTSLTLTNGLRHIGKSAFAGCDKLSKIVVPESVYSIDELAFAFCEKLKSVTIPESVSDIDDGILKGCNNLTDVNIPGMEGDYFYCWSSDLDFEFGEDEVPF